MRVTTVARLTTLDLVADNVVFEHHANHIPRPHGLIESGTLDSDFQNCVRRSLIRICQSGQSLAELMDNARVYHDDQRLVDARGRPIENLKPAAGSIVSNFFTCERYYSMSKTTMLWLLSSVRLWRKQKSKRAYFMFLPGTKRWPIFGVEPYALTWSFST